MQHKPKLLFLGGSDIQIPGIKRAQELGYEVITCDYLPNNPGHQISDGYHDASTTDKEAVLKIAKEEKIDGITAYASDPAALTAAYVAEKLKLPGNPFKSVEILSNKDKFRLFMEEKGYLHPPFAQVKGPDDIRKFFKQHGKSIVKPVDTSGSKGIRVINDIAQADSLYDIAKSFTRNGRVLIEKFIEKTGNQICGDVVVADGKLIFGGYGDVHFDDTCNPITPCSITLPTHHSNKSLHKVNKILQSIFTDLKIKCGTFNVDIFIEGDNVYIVEIGARNGGNLFTEIIGLQSNYDIVGMTLRCSMENLTVEDATAISNFHQGGDEYYYAHYVIHSSVSGIFDDVWFSSQIKDNIIYHKFTLHPGEKVETFQGSNNRVGLCLLKFESRKEMIEKISHFNKYVKITLDENN